MQRGISRLGVLAAVMAPLLAAAPAHADRKDERRVEREDRRFERRPDHRDLRRWDWREQRVQRQVERWDQRRHNGYHYRGRWYYGPPPPQLMDDPQFRPGFAPWRRGAYLPPAFRGVRIHAYDRYRLRPPPAGYAWYRVGDDYLLTDVVTGLILEVVRDD